MVLQLKLDELLRLREARGAAIEVLDGRVWITEDGTGGDKFLGPGGRYRVDGNGLVLVGADAEGAARQGTLVVRSEPRQALWRKLLGLPAALLKALAAAREARATRRELRALSDHALRDIGLRRDQL